MTVCFDQLGAGIEGRRSTVIVIDADPLMSTGGGGWCDVAVPKAGSREEVVVKRKEHEQAMKLQSIGD